MMLAIAMFVVWLVPPNPVPVWLSIVSMFVRVWLVATNTCMDMVCILYPCIYCGLNNISCHLDISCHNFISYHPSCHLGIKGRHAVDLKIPSIRFKFDPTVLVKLLGRGQPNESP